MNKISVIIPSRNRERYILSLLSDLEEQDIPIHEVIVVDQSDHPYNLQGINYIKLDCLGPCKSRNIGIESATGDILVFLDDDINIDANFIAKITEPILNNYASAVAGANCNAHLEYKHQSPGEYLEANTFSWIKLLTANPNFPGKKFSLALPGCCFAIRRDVLESVGYFDEFFDPSGAGEDRELALRVFKAGYNIFYNGEAAIRHHPAPEGGSRDIDSRSVMLNVNLGYIVGKHFSHTLFKIYAAELKREYKKKFVQGIKTGKLIRTHFNLYRRIIRELKTVERELFS